MIYLHHFLLIISVLNMSGYHAMQAIISPDICDAELSLAAGAVLMTLAVYPGSFDPITNGHISILRRGMQIFDKIILAIAHNPQKKSLFTVDDRIEMIHKSLPGEETLEVDTFDGLLVDYAQRRGANVILRGLRALSDFEYEFQMALMNRRLNRDIQSIFLMTDYKWFYISSTIVKEAAMFGGDISGLVPDYVCRKLKEKYGLLKET